MVVTVTFHCYHFVLFKCFSMRWGEISTLILVDNYEFQQYIKYLNYAAISLNRFMAVYKHVLAKLFSETLFSGKKLETLNVFQQQNMYLQGNVMQVLKLHKRIFNSMGKHQNRMENKNITKHHDLPLKYLYVYNSSQGGEDVLTVYQTINLTTGQ